MFKTITLTTLLSISSIAVQAEGLGGGIAFTKHIGLNADYNEIHPFINYEYKKTEVGIYLNSESTLSPYVSYNVYEQGDFKAQLGLVAGYSSKDVLPLAKLSYKNFILIPAVEYDHEDRSSYGVVLGYEFRF